VRTRALVTAGILAAIVATAVPFAGAAEASYPSDLSAAWSPSGREIAFVRYERRDLSAIYVVRPDGTRLRRVYSSPGEATGPVWSPDGRTFAFGELLRHRDGWIENVRIAWPRRRVVSRPVRGWSPTWSPDGRKLAFVRADGLRILDVRTRRVWRIRVAPSPATRIGSPDWSPDGRRLALTVGGNRVAVVPAKGGRLRVIGIGRAPQWSPDGRTIAAACVYSGRAAFLSPERENPLCTDHAIHATAHAPQWRRDGRAVALSGCWDPGGDCGIGVQALGEERPKRIIAPGVYPSWSPDGRRLVFASARWNARLYVAAADGTGVRPLIR
jgi:Tol biopolymer transport system component